MRNFGKNGNIKLQLFTIWNQKNKKHMKCSKASGRREPRTLAGIIPTSLVNDIIILGGLTI
jgi:hypothetical protein